MEHNYDKVRVYDDFPILLDYLKDIKTKRIRRLCQTNCNRWKNCPDNEQNNNRMYKVNPVSFTRKIVDIQNLTNEHRNCLPNVSLPHSEYRASSSLCDPRHRYITPCLNKQSSYILLDDSSYFVDQLDQTLVYNQIGNRIANFKQSNSKSISTVDFIDGLMSNLSNSDIECPLQNRVIAKNGSNLKQNFIAKRIENTNTKNTRIQPTISLRPKSRQKWNSINSHVEIHEKLFWTEVQNCGIDLFSDYIEEEYKLLPTSSKSQAIYENKLSIAKDNNFQDKTTDAQQINNNNHCLIESSFDEMIINENGSDNSNFLIDEEFEDTVSCQSPTLTVPSIPNWEELCERVYRTDHIKQTITNPFDHQMKIFQFWDTSFSPIISNNNSSLDFNIDYLSHQEQEASYNRVENFDLKTTKTLDFESMKNFDLKSFIYQLAKRIFSLRKQVLDKYSKHENHINLENLIEQMPYINTDDEDHFLINPYRLFIFDLCKEKITEMFPMSIDYGGSSTNVDSNSIQLTLMLPLKMQKQPWPLDDESFGKLVYESVHECLMATEKHIAFEGNCYNVAAIDDDGQHNSNKLKRFGLMAFCRMQRKLDFVDRVLYQEMLNDQARWSYFEPEMLEIKNLICDMILEDLILSVLQS